MEQGLGKNNNKKTNKIRQDSKQ